MSTSTKSLASQCCHTEEEEFWKLYYLKQPTLQLDVFSREIWNPKNSKEQNESKKSHNQGAVQDIWMLLTGQHWWKHGFPKEKSVSILRPHLLTEIALTGNL